MTKNIHVAALCVALLCSGIFASPAHAGPIKLKTNGQGAFNSNAGGNGSTNGNAGSTTNGNAGSTTNGNAGSTTGGNAGNNDNGGGNSPAPVILSPTADETLDCTLGCSDSVFGGAVWSTEFIFHPSGTGVFEPFLRLQALGNETTEDGHNTDAKSKDFANDEKGGIWTHSVLVSELTAGTLDGHSGLYYGFALDFGDPAVQRKSLVSLDSLKLCTANDPALTKADDCPTAPYYYNLDAGLDREVLLDYNLIGRGNGASDLVVYVPAFDSPDTYLYLYSLFGTKGGEYQADGTFAEWRLVEAQTPSVPEPASLLLLGGGFAGLALKRRVATLRRRAQR